MMRLDPRSDDCAVYPFDHEHQGTHRDVARLVGGKGASLWAMSRLDIPTPPGFTIATSECERFARLGMNETLRNAVREQLGVLEMKLGRRFGDPANPLLLSVRSGAAASMPGMMDTVLNVGLTPAALSGIARTHGGAAFARDTYERFLKMFATIVLGIEPGESPYDTIVARIGPRFDDPFEQLEMCIEAVFRSWHSPRATVYRERQGFSDAMGTAVNVQAMVFGNYDEASATGVVFTRDPSTGAPTPVGDVLFCAQGEDVVAGTHATRPIDHLRNAEPGLFAELERVMVRLEQYYRDMVDIEFTIESGKLWILQARAGKRSPLAAARIAVDLATDARIGISRAEALALVPSDVLDGNAASRHADGKTAAVARGLGASPGVATGVAVLDPDRAVERAGAGDTVILVRRETSPADVHGMSVAAGILTAHGGQMSHAAVVAREWGIPAVCGLAALSIDGEESFAIGGVALREGDVLSIDGTTGDVFLGETTTVAGGEDPYVAILRDWAAAART